MLSGINNGANMGDDTLYSGTVAAAMEGFLFGIPAIAFSQVQKGWGEIDAAAAAARKLIDRVLAGGMPARAVVAEREHPESSPMPPACRVRITRLGRRHASQAVIRQTNPRGEAIYWIGPAGDARDAGEGTDFHATAQGMHLRHAAAGGPDGPCVAGPLGGAGMSARARWRVTRKETRQSPTLPPLD